MIAPIWPLFQHRITLKHLYCSFPFYRSHIPWHRYFRGDAYHNMDMICLHIQFNYFTSQPLTIHPYIFFHQHSYIACQYPKTILRNKYNLIITLVHYVRLFPVFTPVANLSIRLSPKYTTTAKGGGFLSHTKNYENMSSIKEGLFIADAIK
jgi:hypothetical protein